MKPQSTLFHNPSWIDTTLLRYQSPSDFQNSLFEEINSNLGKIISKDPVVSIVIPAWNEEINIIRTIHSLSKNITSYPFEIIVVNNNSTDGTQGILDRLHVRSFLQSIQGCGPARQLGQENALGKYILMGDADCYYPENWIEKMVSVLKNPGVSCVYGRYSFLGTLRKPRWQLSLYELLRDIVAELRHFKSPYLNALGMSMGYVKDLGLQIGFVNHKIRGEDGRMCFALMNFGKVKQVRSRSSRVWTLPRTLDKEGSLIMSVMARTFLELSRIKDYFYRRPDHNTHTSRSYQPQGLKYFKKFNSVHKNSNEKEGE